MEQFLTSKGYHLSDLHSPPTEKAKALKIQACIHASSHLAEIETRSNLVRELHGDR